MRTILSKILKTVQDIYAKMPDPETKEVKEETKEETKEVKEETKEETKEVTKEEVVETKSTRRAAK